MTNEKLLQQLCDEVDKPWKNRVVPDEDMLYVFKELVAHIEIRTDCIKDDLAQEEENI